MKRTLTGLVGWLVGGALLALANGCGATDTEPGLSAEPNGSPCDNVTCSGKGVCAVTQQGQPACLCAEGYRASGTECLLATSAPVTQPPVTQPPVTQPPVTQPPVTQPPVTQPPVTQPPTRPALCQNPDTVAGLLDCAIALYEALKQHNLPEVRALIEEGQKTLTDLRPTLLQPPQEELRRALLCARLAVLRSQVSRINVQISTSTGALDPNGMGLGEVFDALLPKICQ